MKILTANNIFKKLKEIDWKNEIGNITFSLANINVIINTTDTVGITLQSWLKEFLITNNIYFREPLNTQEFPDFFLSDNDTKNLLEVKAFHYSASPAFDIANFDSYCDSLKQKPYRLNADYLIFGYEMNDKGEISIKDIWLHKIYEISGSSKKYPLKTQVKRNIIYNIRPNSNFKNYNNSCFKSSKEFVIAIYETLKLYKSEEFANNWLEEFKINYFKFYNKVF